MKYFRTEIKKEILASLGNYGTESYEIDKYRVCLAILKLCEQENLSDSSEVVDMAKQDFRDVLAWAEYPNQMKYSPKEDPEGNARLIKQNEEQYRAWLNKSSGEEGG